MPIDASKVSAAFSELIEASLLVDCARRLGHSFTLYGGVVRNFVLSLASIEDRDSNEKVATSSLPASLFDFVDPLSDIDVAVESATDWDLLCRLIRQTCSVAAFYRWEPHVRSIVETNTSGFEHIAIDRLCIRISPEDSIQEAIKFECMGEVASEVLNAISNGPLSIRGRTDGREERLLDRVMVLLKIARYAGQYPRPWDDKDWRSYYEETRALNLRRDTRFLSAVDRFRLESAVLDVVFTCQSLESTSERLTLALKLLTKQQLDSVVISDTLRLLATRAAAPSETTNSHVGVVIYPSTPGNLPKLDRLLLESTSGGHTHIPWVEVTAYGDGGDENCCYRDFSLGCVTIVWRVLLTSEQLQYAPQVPLRLDARIGQSSYRDDVESESDMWYPIVLPAVVQTKVATTIRADHGYVKAIVGRKTTFMIGLTTSSEPGAQEA